MPNIDPGLNPKCPTCRGPMQYKGDIVESHADSPRGADAKVANHVYRCPQHGVWRVSTDGKVIISHV